MLPFAVNQGRGRLSGSFQNVLRLALLVGAGGAEIDAAKESGDKKLVVIQLSHQGAANRAPTAGALPDVPYDTKASHDPNFRVSITFPCSSATA